MESGALDNKPQFHAYVPRTLPSSRLPVPVLKSIVLFVAFGLAGFSFAGFGLLTGAPIAGTILRSDFGFSGLEVFSGATSLAGFIFNSLAFCVHRRQLVPNAKS